MQEYMELCEASDIDRDRFDYYIKTINRLNDYTESIAIDAPADIFEEIHDAKVRLENNFIAFVKALQPQQQ